MIRHSKQISSKPTMLQEQKSLNVSDNASLLDLNQSMQKQLLALRDFNETINFVQENIDEILNCKNCILKLESLLNDPQLPRLKLEALSNAIASADSIDAITLLLQSLRNRYRENDNGALDFIQNALYSFKSDDVIQFMTQIIFDHENSSNLSRFDFPEETIQAIVKGIHLSAGSNDNTISLLKEINSIDPQAMQETINRYEMPNLYGALAIDAYYKADETKFNALLETLGHTQSSQTFDQFLQLFQHVQNEELASHVLDTMYFWSQTNTTLETLEKVEESLTRGTTEKERILAISLLSHIPNYQNSIKILSGALLVEKTPEMRQQISDQLDLLQNRIEAE